MKTLTHTRLALALAAALSLAACGGGGNAPTTAERLDAIDAQMAAGTLTRAQAADARLAIVHELQASDPSAVKIVKLPRSMAPADTQAKMKPELSWFAVFVILSRALTLSGDTCPSCDLEARPIDFGKGDGWD